LLGIDDLKEAGHGAPLPFRRYGAPHPAGHGIQEAFTSTDYEFQA
jgi:hypothetical protein